MHPALLRAVVVAAIAATTEQSRRALLSTSEATRFAAEDALVDRIVGALGDIMCQQDQSTG